MARRLGNFRPRYPDDTPPDGCEECEGRDGECCCEDDENPNDEWTGDDDEPDERWPT